MTIIQHPSRAKCEWCGNELRISTDGIKYQVEKCGCTKNNIQTIIDKFDKEYDGVIWKYDAKLDNDINCYKDIQQFLKDSLTSMLDRIEKELPEKQGDGSLITAYFQGYEDGANQYRQEVINIINSHR